MRGFHKRVARSIVTVLFLSIFTVIAGPVIAPGISTQSAQATTAGIISNGLVLDVNATNSTDMASTSGSYPALTNSGGGYYDLNGTSHYIVPSTATYVGASNVVSIFMWVYPKGAGQLLAQQGTTTINSNYHTAIMEYTSGDQIHVGLWNGSDQTSVNLSSTIATPKNNWYLVGLVYDGSKINGYVNGVYAGSTSNFTYYPPAPAYYGIGAYDVTNIAVAASYGNMRFGELSVYNSALTESDALFNFNATVSRFGPTVNNPSSVSTLTNRYATFTSSACTNATSGSSTCNYQWQLSSDSGSTWNSISGANSNTYTTPLLTSSFNGYRYRMYAWDPGTGTTTAQDLYTITAVATLTVSIPPGSDTDTALTFTSGKYSWHADDNGFDISNALTIEAWVYQTSSIASNWNMVVNKEESYELGTIDGVWYFGLKGSTWAGINTGVPSRLNVWQHVALTRAANTATANLYIDGQLRWSGSADGAGTGALANSTLPFTVGGRSGDGVTFSAPFVGQIDELKIFNSARTQANIQSDMHSYGSISNADLALYYDFNEGSGSTLYNRKSGATSGTDLTMVGANVWSDIKTVTTDSAYTTVTFPRSYLSTSGGWKVPSTVTRVSAVIAAGGGGGGAETDATGWLGGGGGAGGYRMVTSTVASASLLTVTVGQGGRYGISTAAADANLGIPTNGQDSTFANITSLGGGAGAGRSANSGRQNGLAGGSGGGGGTYSGTGGNGTAGQGNNGGTASANCCASGGGGGAGGAGGNGSATGGNGSGGSAGDGILNPMYISGTNAQYLAAGGAGGGLSSNGATGSKGGVGFSLSAPANSGSGGGGGGGQSYINGGFGGSGVVIVRWITASKPIFTQPTIDTTTAGLSDTITVSANPISPLTRNYLWQSSSDTGTSWANVSTGSGFTSQIYTTPMLETTTSGIRYQYRVVVTDSDTAGLSITDTSTAVYVVVNPRIVISGTYTIQKYGATHVDTFTTVAGTGTGNEFFTFSPNNRAGITWNGSVANQATLTIARTLGPGTYFETMTATDTKGASTQYPISIVVSKADTITVTSLARTDTYTSSALTFTPGYTVAGLQNSDTVTLITWSYSGTENSLSSYGPSATKPLNAGSYTITPTAVISNVDSYTAVVYETSMLTVNRATRTITASVLPSPLKFGATGTLSSTPSAGAGDGAVTYSTSTTDSCTVSSVNLQALKSTGTCSFTARISRGNNYETATSTSTSVSLTKADTLTVSVNAITPVTYTGSPAAVSPTVTVTGLALSNSVGSGPATIRYVGQGNIGSTCSQGGTCVVGDTGPGGGIVFYVAPSLQSWGRYLEAAPATWSGGPDNQAGNISKWCEAATSVDSTKFTGLYNGIGLGYDNTYDSRLNVCTGGAIYKARAYRGGGYTNWFLPNSTELALMADVSVRSLIGLVNDSNLWGYWGSYEDAGTGFIGSLVTNSWGIGSTNKSEAMKNMTRPIRAFAEGGVGTTTFSSPPTDAGTYTVKASALTLSSGSLSDYQGVTYTDGSLLINRAKQQALVIAQYAALFGTPYKVMIYGGSGLGALSQVVSAGTATGCTLSGDTLTSTTVGTCNLTATKAQDKNYETATATAFVYFLTYTINQPVATPSTSSEIALSGATSVTLESTAPPSITGLSTLTLSLSGGGTFTITGTGFAGSITVKFWRNKSISATSGNGTTITIPVSSIQSTGATSGRIAVITSAGEAVSVDSLTINP